MIQRTDATMRPNENQGPTILASTLAVTVIALISTVARLYVRVKMIRNFGWDDYIMIAAMALCVTIQGLIVPQVVHGAGRHVEYIDREDFKTALKFNFITQPLYVFAICFVKISVGLFLLRIAVKPFYRRLILGIIGFMTIYTIGCFLTLVLQCTDIRMVWDRGVKGTCWSSTQLRALGYTNAALNISTDIAFSIAIPIPMLWGVQMNRRQKASLICILGLGMFATAAALVKLTYLPNYGSSGDLLWDSRNLTIWTITECNIGIIAGNLPCLKPLFRSILVSTYGLGSHKASEPNYFSKSYGPGTKSRSSVRNYASLASGKTADGEFRGYGAAGEAYMLTTVNAKSNARGDAWKSSSGRSSPVQSKSSTESETRLNNKALKASGMGDIKVTTKVDVIESVHSPEIYENGTTHHRQQTKELV